MKIETLKYFLFKEALPRMVIKGESWLTFRKHEVLAREGETAHAAYLLYRGKVQLIKKHSDHQYYVITTLSGGSTIGLPSLLTHSSYTSTAVTTSSVRACRVERDTLLQFLCQYPQYYQVLAEQLAQTVNHYEKIIERQQESF